MRIGVLINRSAARSAAPNLRHTLLANCTDVERFTFVGLSPADLVAMSTCASMYPSAQRWVILVGKLEASGAKLKHAVRASATHFIQLGFASATAVARRACVDLLMRESDRVLIFADGARTRGTRRMVALAESYGVQAEVARVDAA